MPQHFLTPIATRQTDDFMAYEAYKSNQSSKLSTMQALQAERSFPQPPFKPSTRDSDLRRVEN